jgi:hypothetical protein
MRTIGTDVDLSVCKSEGYLMVQFDARKPFNAKTGYRLFAYYPDYIISESPELKNICMTDLYMDAESLWNIYMDYKQGIDSFVGFTHKFPTDIYGFLSLASDVDPYCGLR